MASSTGIPGTNQARDDTEPLLGQPGDATQKPTQGLQWNLVTGTAVIAQAGIWILTALVWSSVFNADFSFFSYHPLLNSLALLITTQAILLLQPTAIQSQKVQGAYIHGTLNTIATGLFIAALVVIEMNKASHPETRFQSTHGKVGLLVYIIFAIQLIVGIVQFLVPNLVLGSWERGKAIYKYHRSSGYVILLLGLVTVCLAVETGFNENVLHMKLWAVIVASVITVVGVVPRIKRSKLGL